MTSFPASPRLTKGAIVGFDAANPLASVIVFQYNPSQLTRDLKARTPQEEEGATNEVLRLAGPPRESIRINALELDAADQLEKGDPVAGSMGIAPQLAALEMLLYPKSAQVIASTALLLAGTIEFGPPPEAPFTLFIWGAKRVLPVRIKEFTIEELHHDPQLNPIVATVNLSMDVLSYADFGVEHPGYHLFLAHQLVKEAMAVVGSARGAASAVSASIDIG